MSFAASLLTTLISLFVLYKSEKVPNQQARLVVRAIAGLVFTISLFSSLFRTVAVIPTGEVGVTELFGQVNSRPLNSGVHLLNPFVDMETYSTRLQDMTETIEATSQEGMEFNVDVSLQYQVDPQKVVEIYRTVGKNESEIIRSRFRSIVREITATYPAEAIYSTKRQDVAHRIEERISEELGPLGFTVDAAYLREVVLPETLQAAIQEKLKAEQQSRQMTFTLEQARQEAERKRIEAQGTADAQAILGRTLTEETLQLRAIEAMETLARSNNAKVVVVGGQNGMPTILPLDQP